MSAQVAEHEVAVYGLLKDQVREIWPMAKAYLARVEEQVPEELSLDDVLQGLLSGEMQLWLAAQGPEVLAFCVTKVLNYSKMKSVQILWLAGKDLDVWRAHGMEVLSEWGRSLGAKRLELLGRKGWKRVLEKDGWVEPHVVLHKEI